MSGPGCLAAPLVFRAPSGPAARVVCLARPGCLVCPWAAARPRDRHTRAFGSEWSISKPALALLPSGALRTGGACGAVCRLEAQPGPVAAHGYRSLALRHPGLAVLLLVAPLVFWAPSGPAAWPGCLVCPWAAARPRAVRAASFARRVVSKPGQAPPPPTGSAAWPSGAQALLFCCLWHRWCSGAVGPGRPRDRHTRAFGSEWSILKPALALRTLRRSPHWRRLCRCVWWSFPSKLGHAPPPARSPHTSLRLGVVDLEARPCPPDPPAPSTPAALARLCVASKPGQAPPSPMGTAARLSGPSGTLHAGGAAGICN